MSETKRVTAQPTDITLHQASRTLTLQFDDGEKFDLSCEFLRVFTPSAEARGHAPGQEVLQVGKRNVTINSIDPIGNYAVRLVFSDGHDTGLYSWDMLYEFGRHYDELWAAYLEKVEKAGASRDPIITANTGSAAGNAAEDSCGSGACKSGGCGR